MRRATPLVVTTVVLGFGALGAPVAQAGVGCDQGMGSVRVGCSDPPSFQFPNDGVQQPRQDTNAAVPEAEAPVASAQYPPQRTGAKHHSRHHKRKHHRRH